MNKKLFSVITISIVIIMIITSVIYIVNTKKNEGNINEKVEEELDFIGKELINMINSINNISFNNYSLQINKETSSNNNQKEKEDKSSDEKKSEKEVENFSLKETGILNKDLYDINWNYLKNNSEKLYNIWTTSIIDLHSLNVNNEDILEFSNKLDLSTISSKNEDKDSFLTNLVELYSYIPKFFKQINSKKEKILVANTIDSILRSYMYVNQDNWNDTKIAIEESQKSYIQIINIYDENSLFSKYKLTRIYVLLNELDSSISLKDKDIYFIKYQNVIEALINL